MYKYKKKGKTLPFLYPPSHGPKVIFWTQMGPLVWTDPFPNGEVCTKNSKLTIALRTNDITRMSDKHFITEGMRRLYM